MTNDPSLSPYERRYLAFILFSILVLVISDLAGDFSMGGSKVHLAIELALALGTGVGLVYVIRVSFRRTKILTQALLDSRRETLESEREAQKWKEESLKHVKGLSEAIDHQFDRWQLSQSEKEVALLLLKGLSLKEIAGIRTTSEKTARAQSVAIYSKSGLAGRSELSAFFLEDLLLPQAD